MAQVILLDATEMEPPEPLVRTLEIIETLEQGDYLRFRNTHEPHLLYDNLHKRHFSYLCCNDSDIFYDVFIWRENDALAYSTIQQLVENKSNSLTLLHSSLDDPDS
ncbi:MAG: DUF2249 domain-containing protein [Gammaproteobacteria bacterium]|nr:DUF2249 domain-containing protein [Gammaproteobacteria bacterium]